MKPTFAPVIKAICSLFAVAQIGAVSAQSSPCSEYAKILLPEGAYDIGNIHITEESYRSVIQWYKQHRDDTYQESKKRSAELIIPIDAVLVGLNLSQNDSSYNRFINNIESYENQFAQYKSEIQQSWKIINVEAIEALNKCQIETQGFQVIKLTTIDPSVLVFRFYYNNDYSNAPSSTKVIVDDVTENLSFNHNVLRRIELKGKDHADLVVRRLNSKSASISFKPKDNDVRNLATAFVINPIANNSTNRSGNEINVAAGEVKENAKLFNEWGIVDVDPDASNMDKWRKVPINTSHYREAAWTGTVFNTREYKSNGKLYWTAEMINRLGGKSGPNGLGGSGTVAPEYRTTITLPDSAGSESKLYSIHIKCGTYVNSTDSRTGFGKKGLVRIENGAFSKQFEFRVDNDWDDEGLSLDSVPAGEYMLSVRHPEILHGSKGLHVNDPNAASELSFATNLSVSIVQLKMNSIAPEPNRSWVYILLSLALTVIIGWIIVSKKRST